MRAAESLDFRLDRWAREAKELATCVECYGVGEDRDAPGRACPACSGRGRAAREPHVLELVSMVRDRDARLEATAELVADRSALLTELESQAERRLDLEQRAGAAEALASLTVGRLMRAEDEADQLRVEVDRLRVELYRLRDERQAGRAEVERLRGIVEVNDQRLAAVWDEARAEVERLRDELRRARRREGED